MGEKIGAHSKMSSMSDDYSYVDSIVRNSIERFFSDSGSLAMEPAQIVKEVKSLSQEVLYSEEMRQALKQVVRLVLDRSKLSLEERRKFVTDLEAIEPLSVREALYDSFSHRMMLNPHFYDAKGNFSEHSKMAGKNYIELLGVEPNSNKVLESQQRAVLSTVDSFKPNGLLEDQYYSTRSGLQRAVSVMKEWGLKAEDILSLKRKDTDDYVAELKSYIAEGENEQQIKKIKDRLASFEAEWNEATQTK